MTKKIVLFVVIILLKLASCSEIECPVGSYLSKPGDTVCAKCADQCDKCTGPTYNQCVQFSKELTQCYEGSFMEVEKVCQSCASGCKVCTGPLKEECLQEYYVPTTCYDGMFLDENFVCQNCSQNCQLCSGPSESECQKKYYVPTNCYEGKFLTAQKTCQQCSNLCKKCSGPSKAECSEFYPTAPPLTCDWDGYFKNSSQLCEQCHVQCSKCIGASFNSCLLFYPTSPEAICPVTYFKNKDVACQKCIKANSQCLQCTGPTFEECQVFQPLDCSIGQYFDNAKDSCENCIPGCAKCTGPEKSQCSECLPGYIKNDDGDCSLCSTSCQTCSTPSVCQVCDTTFFPQSNGQCASCTSKCNSCIGPSWAECHSFQPGVLNELQTTLKTQADSYYMHYDTSSSSLVDNINVNGHSQFVQCTIDQLDSELAKYNFPSDITSQIQTIVFMASTTFTGFKFLVNDGQASEQQYVGCARNIDGIIQFALVQVSTTGSLVQQYNVQYFPHTDCNTCWHFWTLFRCCHSSTSVIRTPIGFTGSQLIQVQQALQAEANAYIQNVLEFPPANFLNYKTVDELKSEASQIKNVQS